MDPRLHPLEGVTELPKQFNNPFNYEPDALSLRAMGEVMAYLENHPGQVFAAERVTVPFAEEIAKDKFGLIYPDEIIFKGKK